MNVNLQDGVRIVLEVHKEIQPEGYNKIIIHTDNEHYLHILNDIIHVLSDLESAKGIIDHNNCNDCLSYKICLFKPSWGEPVRANCPFYVGETST